MFQVQEQLVDLAETQAETEEGARNLGAWPAQFRQTLDDSKAALDADARED